MHQDDDVRYDGKLICERCSDRVTEHETFLRRRNVVERRIIIFDDAAEFKTKFHMFHPSI